MLGWHGLGCRHHVGHLLWLSWLLPHLGSLRHAAVWHGITHAHGGSNHCWVRSNCLGWLLSSEKTTISAYDYVTSIVWVISRHPSTTHCCVLRHGHGVLRLAGTAAVRMTRTLAIYMAWTRTVRMAVAWAIGSHLCSRAVRTTGAVRATGAVRIPGTCSSMSMSISNISNRHVSSSSSGSNSGCSSRWSRSGSRQRRWFKAVVKTLPRAAYLRYSL